MITTLILSTLAWAGPRPRPEPLPETTWAPPEPTARTLSAAAGGLPVYIVENHETPVFEVRIVVPRGGWTDPPELPGLSSAAMTMVLEGTTTRSAEQIAIEARRLGAELGAGANRESVSIGIGGLTRTMPEAVALLADVVRNPTFPAEAWGREQTRRVTDASARLERAEVLARQVMGTLVYGPSYYGLHDTPETWQRATRDDVEGWYRSRIVPDGAFLLVGGDIDPDAMIPLLEQAFAGFSGQATAATPPTPPLAAGDRTVFVVDRPGAPQSMVSTGTLVAVPPADAERFRIANELLGGAFTSRINSNLREDKGWTYGARCAFGDDRFGPAWFGCQALVRADVTADAFSEIEREIREATTTRLPTDEEVATYRSSLLLSQPGAFESTRGVLDLVSTDRLLGRPADWTASRPAALAAVDTAGVTAALTSHVDLARLYWLVVGDAATAVPALKAKGYTVQVLDKQARPVP